MNRTLLAGCAMVALGVGCGSTAFAADAIPATTSSGAHVLINGDAYFEGGYTTGENTTNDRAVDFRNRIRVNIIPTFKADNGLEYGARLRIRNGGSTTSGSTSANVDRAYIFVKGMFGEVDLGQTDGIDDNVGTIIPNTVGTGFGIDGDWAQFADANAVTGTFLSDHVGISGNVDTKIAYYSPVFAGFQIAAAYTPQANNGGFSVNQSANTATTGPIGTGNGAFQDVYEIDGLYSGTVGPVGIAGNVAYSGGRSTDNQFIAEHTKDLKSVKAGLQLTYGGFAVGGEYVNSFDSGYSQALSHKVDQQAWSVGGQYTTGPFVLAAAYARGIDGGPLAGSGTGASRHINLYSAGVDYNEAPGLATGLEWDHYYGKAGGGTIGDHGDIVVVTQKLSF